VRISSIGRLDYLLFLAIASALLGLVPKAHASFTSLNQITPGASTGIDVTLKRGLAGISFTVPSSNRSPMTLDAVTSNARFVVLAGAVKRISSYGLTNGANYTVAVTAEKAAGHQASGSASNGIAQSVLRPLILFTDITSGPNSGGENNNGIYLTIFGTHFGATRRTSKVTIGGKAVAQYLLWSDTKIGVQVGHVSSGPIVVAVGGVSSNSNLTFTVRSGHIYYIGASVDNSAPSTSCSTLLAANSYVSPWGMTNYANTTEANYSASKMRTTWTYYHCLSLGDTLVFLNGFSYPYYDGRGWHASLTLDKTGASASSFITFMARPGASVQLGGAGSERIICDISNGYNVFSGLTFTGFGSTNFNAGGSVQNDRLVGNEITCPGCYGATGAVLGGNGFTMYGNTIDNVSTLLPSGSNKTYHAVYVAGNNIEIAWNKIYNTRAYNGIQIHHDRSSGFYNISIHDNDIADVNGSGINLSTIDPSSGYVKVFNNVIHHVGLNSANGGSGGDPHSCIAIKGYGSATAAGTIEIYNNTMYDCSSYLNVNPSNNSSCAILDNGLQLNVTTNLVNNIVYQPAYAGTAKQNVYICGGSIGTLSGSNNLWYSERAPRSTAPVTSYGTIANPRFVSATDYHLQSGSPAIGAGIAYGGLVSDFDAAPRRNPPAIGAYEYSMSAGAARASLAGTTPAQSAVVSFPVPPILMFDVWIAGGPIWLHKGGSIALFGVKMVVEEGAPREGPKDLGFSTSPGNPARASGFLLLPPPPAATVNFESSTAIR
jgi:hypothetical protein